VPAVTKPPRPLLVSAVVLSLLPGGCGDESASEAADSPAPTHGAASGPGVEGDITVFAAASLTESFSDIGVGFEAANPDADATFSFDASSALVRQIVQGAPADVFASADTATMDELTERGLDGTEPEIFATNVLTIIVPRGNPAGITGVEDLADPDVTVVLCAEEVPCGRYAKQVLDTAGVAVRPASLEQNVRGVVTKVTAGEADAGIVYATDVTAAGDAAARVEIPEDINVRAEYPIATVAASGGPEVGQAFVDFVLGEEGQAILADHGFGPAP
jgi:molybdate transport system substrate-binding protein